MISRRKLLVSGAAAVSVAACSPQLLVRRPPAIHARQFHNQPAASTLHQHLVGMWAAIEAETDGAIVVETFPQNNGLGDPKALEQLVSGELEFFALWSAISGDLVPAVEIQALAFLFEERSEALRFVDGELAPYLLAELERKGIRGFLGGCFENGFRQLTTASRPVDTAADLEGLVIRTPRSSMYEDFFRTLGAVPKVINFNEVYEALRTGVADGQDNPIEVTIRNRFHEVQKYLNLTNHAWSGFQQMANLKFWNALPDRIQAAIGRNVPKYVALQRAEQDRLNRELLRDVSKHGLEVHATDRHSIVARLGPFYARWRRHFGEDLWQRLENALGHKVG
jgi:tripartite ATP-independent transporter DctP family solute receptor